MKNSFLLSFMLMLSAIFQAEGRVVDMKASVLHRSLAQKDFMYKDTEYRISGYFSLRGKTIVIPEGCTLCFASCTLANGRITGQGTSVFNETPTQPSLDGVMLDGTWKGYISDSWFRKSGYNDDASILESVLHFNQIHLTFPEYNIRTWKTMFLNDGDVVLDGNGVKIHLPQSKGTSINTEWGPRLSDDALIKSSSSSSTLRVSDVEFVDSFIDSPVIYYCIYPGARKKITLENVSSSGCCGLMGLYNSDTSIDSLVFRNCSVRTSQFAIEVANRVKGKTGVIELDRCRFSRSTNSLFVGPLSFVCDGYDVQTLSIHDCVLEGELTGNVEASGISDYSFCGNVCRNHFAYSGVVVPKVFVCRDNVLTLEKPSGESTQIMQIAGNSVSVTGNTFHIVSSEFPRLELMSPDAVDAFQFTDNTIRFDSSDTSDHGQYFLDFKTVKGRFDFRRNSFQSASGRFPVRMNISRKASGFENPFPKDCHIIRL